MELSKFLDLKDISLIPNQISYIESRKSINTSSKLGDLEINIPIIAAPMNDVCDGDFGDKLVKLGCFGIIHRFCSIEQQIKEFYKNPKLACAIGINNDYLERFITLNNTGCNMFCIDIANGGNSKIKNIIEELLNIGPTSQFIVGNVASKEVFEWLSSIKGVVGIRVGVSGGFACTTKNATGIYNPMASLIIQCKSVKKENGPAIIADGGIKEPQDLCKAIALGANYVMMGSVLASALESPAELIKNGDTYYKVYHGSASFEIQSIHKEKPNYIEGTTKLLPFNDESIEQIVERFSDGLKSCMSYFNSSNIETFQKNSNWCIV